MKFQLIGLVTEERKSIFYAFPIWLATFLVPPNQFLRQRTWEDWCLIGQMTMQKSTFLIGCFNTSRKQCEVLSLLSVTTQNVPWVYKKYKLNYERIQNSRLSMRSSYYCVLSSTPVECYVGRTDSATGCLLPHLPQHYNKLKIFSRPNLFPIHTVT
jgi:hypothetical protein